jgi:hypothetical protein
MLGVRSGAIESEMALVNLSSSSSASLTPTILFILSSTPMIIVPPAVLAKAIMALIIPAKD